VVNIQGNTKELCRVIIFAPIIVSAINDQGQLSMQNGKYVYTFLGHHRQHGNKNSAVVFQSTMFSSLASYLLGNQSYEPHLSPEAVTADVRLRAVDSDDDWVLVEKTGIWKWKY